MKTSFRELKNAGACRPRYAHFAKSVGGIRKYGIDTPITALQILDTNGIDDLWWCWSLFDKQKSDRIARIYACDYADNVRHLMDDPRSHQAIDVARCYANGEATDSELAAAASAAWAAAAGTAAGTAAAFAAAFAAESAASAASAARSAAWEWQLKRMRELLEEACGV